MSARTHAGVRPGACDRGPVTRDRDSSEHLKGQANKALRTRWSGSRARRAPGAREIAALRYTIVQRLNAVEMGISTSRGSVEGGMPGEDQSAGSTMVFGPGRRRRDSSGYDRTSAQRTRRASAAMRFQPMASSSSNQPRKTPTGGTI